MQLEGCDSRGAQSPSPAVSDALSTATVLATTHQWVNHTIKGKLADAIPWKVVEEALGEYYSEEIPSMRTMKLASTNDTGCCVLHTP